MYVYQPLEFLEFFHYYTIKEKDTLENVAFYIMLASFSLPFLLQRHDEFCQIKNINLNFKKQDIHTI